MDSSPIVKAQDHARAAAVATRQPSADTTVAINEHTKAAGEFASIAKNTSSLEALRTLKLLEEHHSKLAQLLQIPAEEPEKQTSQDDNEKGSADAGATTSEKSSKRTKDAAQDTGALKKLGVPGQRRIAAREMSSSIASNLASARGIRSSKFRGQPLSPSVSNDQGRGDLDAHPRRDASRTKMQNLIEQPGKPTWVPPGMPSSTSRSEGKPPRRAVTAPPESTADDGGYTRFYNTFGSLINKISAPLAFAGLPLIQEESAIAQEPQSPEPPKRDAARPTTSAGPDPELSKIFSKAALRSIDGHNTSDSFYVVPTTGHTMSYANILSYDKKERRRLGASTHSTLDDEDEDFVDARETPVPLSPGAKRRIGKASTPKELNNTIEELHTENKSLKNMIDMLTKRLHVFEASSQNSHLALAESYRLLRPGSPMSAGGREDSLKRENSEAELAAVTKQLDKLERENKKMQKTLDKYREKWETLKAGARARMGAQSGLESVEEGV